MPERLDYLEIDVAVLTDDQLWWLRKTLKEGRKWLTEKEAQLTRQDDRIADELAARLAGKESPTVKSTVDLEAPMYEICDVKPPPGYQRGRTSGPYSPRRDRFDWKQASDDFLSALRPGMKRAQWVDAVREKTGETYSTYQVNTVLDVLRGRGMGAKAQDPQISQSGTRGSVTYQLVSTKKRSRPGTRAKRQTPSIEEQVREAYARFGNMRAAASHLGMARSTFADRCKEFGVPTQRGR